ncbi:hypothetical protein LEMA_P076790.1 [Plenodomus lingam JN3]|uniref:Uncharacterized protein n=1 Tax=Leptosphaeria maculans (strain JN3 / isolate v23.1.3 / race Av1-4-5-6-7-8) TaxID=985895 RepID=E5A8Z5_LEPMJ|nr:hypothetical protein LEMA_P076790.1 [Plenodomus lingam JN3]CBY00090.1 hypothetical protein LEMA_P076790.1 [Plenodomus lingam JN3]
MDIKTRDTSPSTKSDTSQLSYTNDYNTLPATGPTNHAHILHLPETNASSTQDDNPKLQDALVTTLFHVSPAILQSFMSPTTHTFKAIFGKKDIQLLIWRKGLEVFVGTYEHHTTLKAYRFERVAGFLIGYDGVWHLQVTAADAYCNAKWAEVWAGKFFDYGGVTQMVVEGEVGRMEKRAGELAGAIVRGRFWGLKCDVKVT